METVITSQGHPEPSHLNRMGWYERPSQNVVEFWWQGREPKIVLDALMLEFMPTEIVMEIKTSVTVKAPLED